MRCKNHYTDLSSNVGVCASCLRERLFPLVAAHEPQAQQKCLLETHPRSVSPYISQRKSDYSASSINNQHNGDRNRHHSVPDQRFFSTPDVAPVTGSYNSCQKKKHSLFRFSLLSNLFRSKKRNENSNPKSSGGDDSATSATSSPFWFLNPRSGGGCRKKQQFCHNDASTAAETGVMRKQYCSDRGMSPVRSSDCDGAEGEFYDRSEEYETCASRKQTPRRTPAHPSVRRGGGGGYGKNVSGFSFCLSPLVRVSPCRNWKQNGVAVAPVDSGEIRAPVMYNNNLLFGANRSRKVADFGRCAADR
ncbi:hypothetical protein Hdeb2414_s0020g00568501 [Helianthus debilis subsp. tardiflorus]